jgi:hypothetical protein
MSMYEFSNPVHIGSVSPKLGAALAADWPSERAPLKYRYTGLGDRRLGKQYRYTGLETDVATAAATTAGVQQLLSRLSGSASFRASLNQASGVINLVLGAAQLGTGIASAACSGCDRTGIDITNNIIGWIRALLNGQAPTVAGLTPAQVQGFVDFCNVKDAVKGGVDAAFAIGQVAAYNNSGVQSALSTVQGFIDNFLDAICQIPAVVRRVHGLGSAFVGHCATSRSVAHAAQRAA